MSDGLVLMEVRDCRDWPAPWFGWALIDSIQHTVIGYFKRRIDAERELERLTEQAAK